jgi:hypothetical protein
MNDKTKKENSNGKKGQERQGEHDAGQESSAAASGTVQWGIILGSGGSGTSL